MISKTTNELVKSWLSFGGRLNAHDRGNMAITGRRLNQRSGYFFGGGGGGARWSPESWQLRDNAAALLSL